MEQLLPTVLLVALFLLLEGFFSGSEYLLISFNRVKLRAQAEGGDKSARILEGLLRTPERIFGATSTGTNICVFAGTSLVTALLAPRFGDEADLWSFLIMGPTTLILGEIVPKILFRQRAESLAPFIVRPLAASQRLFAPILWVTSGLARLVLKVFLGEARLPATLVTREELILMTKAADTKLDLDTDERRMIDRIFAFRGSTADEVMQPLVNLVAISTAETVAGARARIAESGYSRLPVFHERIFNIVGTVSAFDILAHPAQNDPVEKVMRPPLYTPATKRSPVLLKKINEANAHMAVVVDEYGGAVGVVTVEDLVEEIVGDIEDEFDAPAKRFEVVDRKTWIVDALIEVDYLNETLGLSLPEGDYETVNGLINESLERIPRRKTQVAVGCYLLTVLDATPKRATSVRIEDVGEDAPEAGAAS